jgi:hypothetical protein
MYLVLSLYLLSTPVSGAADAMNLIKEDIKPVVEFSMNWSVKVALGITSTHAFIVLCKRFLGS